MFVLPKRGLNIEIRPGPFKLWVINAGEVHVRSGSHQDRIEGMRRGIAVRVTYIVANPHVDCEEDI